MKSRPKSIGFLLVILGSIFWGIGGTVSQQLFQTSDVTVDWLVTVRLLISGLLLLAIQAIFKDTKPIIQVWKQKAFAIRLIIFSIVGMMFVQYTYMAAIHAGNAAIATLLQYLAPVMIIIFIVVTKQANFTKQDAVTVILALSGSFFLLTNGSLATLAVPLPAIVWGLLSGAALAFYTLYAVPLLKNFSALVIVGWGMTIAGLIMCFIHPPWAIETSHLNGTTILYIFIVVIFGTMLANWFYIESLQILSAKETSLLANIEPLTAVVATVVWLHEPFGSFQWLGTTLIILMMVYLALQKKDS